MKTSLKGKNAGSQSILASRFGAAYCHRNRVYVLQLHAASIVPRVAQKPTDRGFSPRPSCLPESVPKAFPMAVESIMLGIAHWRRIVLIAWIWTCANVCGHAAQMRDQELAGSLLAGLRDHVESLRSGVVEFEVLDKNGRRVAKRFAAFDVKDGNLRSDTLENSRFADRIVKVICTKDQFVQFLDNKGDTKLIELNVGETSMVEDGSPIDLRALGMCSYSQMSQGASAEAILKALDKARVISASLENDIGVIVLDPNHADGETRLVWWIDTAHGYVPLRQEVRLGSNVCQKFETSWARMNGIMVPVRSAFSFLLSRAVRSNVRKRCTSFGRASMRMSPRNYSQWKTSSFRQARMLSTHASVRRS